MLKVQRKANGDVVFTVSGRLDAENVGELSALFTAEPAGRALMLDLKDLLLVDRNAVRFLRLCEGDSMVGGARRRATLTALAEISGSQARNTN
jgi:hypothetical protein